MKPFDLDKPIINFGSETDNISFTIRDSITGCAVFGATGSGKTSGGKTLALNLLLNNYGGLVLTVKSTDKADWIEYCRLTGRENDLIIIGPGEAHSFNFLEYESKNSSGEQAYTANIAQVLKTVILAGAEKDSGHTGGADPFWQTASDMLIFHCIDIAMMAYGKVSVQLLYDLVQSLPNSNSENVSKPKEAEENEFEKAYKLARKKVLNKISLWEQSLSTAERLQLNENGLYESAFLNAIPDAKLFKLLDQFFCVTYKNLSEKTRSIIDFSFAGWLFQLLREPVYSLFCERPSTVTPEDSIKGKIILIDLPVKLYHEAGRSCQILYKYIWQRAMEKREINAESRPVFLWADEAQNFLHQHDADFQATARSSLIATIYITQNLHCYYSVMGGAKSEHRVKAFLGTLNTKIFMANADAETNSYASSLIGDAFFEDLSAGVTVAENFSKSRNTSLKLERILRPESFVQLKTGGPLNNYLVEGVLHRQGNRVRKGFNHAKITFDQNYNPKLFNQ
ncbi:TraM recognition domain-containing protein [Mucilaginibacter sp. BJC16-A38]|uniref:type IV secretory system conjugative DNA transfer family protein n=1 Tax=Mucilaginibacter phenanthrenivorans TaxID=1234842 RepID=UPI0021585176|nr:TraG/TraD/VirD4 family protein [Mucilaginibacter phenanthrenivorans]MCR8561038.1 TraM recognition domain-containing protein [Mucilaginibacter phenanthrenivorans]